MVKKIILLIIAFTLILSSGTSAALDDAKLYYSFDKEDIDGNIVKDLSGNDNEGTNDGATTGAKGKINEAFDFDGTNDGVTDKDFSISSNDLFTVSFWIYDKSTTPAIRKWVTTTDAGFFERTIVVREMGGEITFVCGHTSGHTYGTSGRNSDWKNSWRHFVLVSDGSECMLYENGAVLSKVRGGVIPETGLFIGTGIVDPTIGGTGTEYAEGIIDELAIYERALSEEEVLEVYNNGNGYNPYKAGVGARILGIIRNFFRHGVTINIGYIIAIAAVCFLLFYLFKHFKITKKE